MKMRKRCCFVFLCIFAAIYISGCGKEDRRKNDEDKLSVYLLEGSSFIEMIDEYNHEQEKETDKIEYKLFPVEDYENIYKKMTSELYYNFHSKIYFYKYCVLFLSGGSELLPFSEIKVSLEKSSES